MSGCVESTPLSTTPTRTPAPVVPAAHSASAPTSWVPRLVWSAKRDGAAISGRYRTLADCTVCTSSSSRRCTRSIAVTDPIADIGDTSATAEISGNRKRIRAPAFRSAIASAPSIPPLTRAT
jgi:hypothetical protein